MMQITRGSARRILAVGLGRRPPKGLVFVLMCLGLLGNLAEAGDLDRVRETGRLVVAVYESFPPFSAQDAVGTPTGIDVEIGLALAERLGVKGEIRLQPADESVEDDLRNAVWKGHYIGGGVADVMLHIPIDPIFSTRIPQVTFIAPYFREEVRVAYDPARFSGDLQLEAFDAHLVGVETATLADDFLLSTQGGRFMENVRHYPTQAEAVAAIVAGEIDAVLGNAAELDALIDAHEGLRVARIELFGLRRPFWDLGAAVKSEHGRLALELNRAMDAMEQDGTLDRIFEKFGVSRLKPTIQPGPGMQSAGN